MADYYYITSEGIKINFHGSIETDDCYGLGTIFSDEHWCYGYCNDYEISNGRIKKLEVPSVEKTVTVYISADTAYKAAQLRTKMHEYIQRDVDSENMGQLCIGSYTLNCFLIGLDANSASIGKQKIFTEVKIVAPKCEWVCPYAVYIQNPVFSGNVWNGNISCDISGTRDFELTLYGPMNSPRFRIGNNEYRLSKNIASGQRVVIDSKKKTITLHKADYTTENWFRYRIYDDTSYLRANSIFEKMSVSNDTDWMLDVSHLNAENMHVGDIVRLYVYDTRKEPPFYEAEPVIEYLLDSNGNQILDSAGSAIQLGW